MLPILRNPRKSPGWRLGGHTDIRIINIEAAEWANAYQRHTRQAEQLPVSVLQRWGCLIGDRDIDIPELLFARSSRIAVEAGLWRNDLLNTAPSTISLMGEGIVGFSVKTKTRWESEGRPCWDIMFSYSTDCQYWLKTGYVLFIEKSGDQERDFWLGRPFESTRDGFKLPPPPAFWSCAGKMVSPLMAAGHPEGRGIRPHSLKATKITALTTEVIRGKANLSQLQIRKITGEIHPEIR